MLDWVKDKLYSRWSFNILIWHGFRLILRFPIFYFFGEVILSNFNPGYPLFAILLVISLPTHLVVFAPAIIMFYLEKKRGIRINRKILDNNKIFIPYFILSIPSLIVELLWIILAIVGSCLPFLHSMLYFFENLSFYNPFESWMYVFSPDFYKAIFLFFI